MKVILLNSPTTECGVSEFGRRMEKALKQKGVILLPQGAPADLIHVNWHPFTFGEDYLPPNPLRLPISVYLHDTPQHSRCALWDVAKIRFTSEPFQGAIEVPYPATDFIPEPFTEAASRPIIGTTGLRGDGSQSISDFCTERGWTLNAKPPGWQSDETEIQRLSKSDLNILWYYASGRGKSLALMTCAAARRPLLLNSSEMFSQARPYSDEIYIAAPGIDLPVAVDWALGDNLSRKPQRILEDLSWSAALERRILPAWRSLISRS